MTRHWVVSLVPLDRRTSTLHPGAGPSLPPHYFAAIDGVVIGPNVGSCGSAAWSGELTRADDIATDPRWVPIRDAALGVGLADAIVRARPRSQVAVLFIDLDGLKSLCRSDRRCPRRGTSWRWRSPRPR
jgi:hypothetical protein